MFMKQKEQENEIEELKGEFQSEKDNMVKQIRGFEDDQEMNMMMKEENQSLKSNVLLLTQEKDEMQMNSELQQEENRD